MNTAEIVLMAVIGVLTVVFGVAFWLLRLVSSTLHPLPRDYALSLTEPLYDLLCAPTVDTHHFLLSQTPNRAERWALARVVAAFSRDVVECNPVAVRVVVNMWHLEEVVVWRIEHLGARGRNEALDVLMRLYPSEASVRRVVRRTFASPPSALRQLLLVIYFSPERVVELLARHPYTLSWADAGSVVEVLKMHSLCCRSLATEGVESPNVDMLLLRLAAEEGVGSVAALAKRCATSDERELRTAAMNLLLEESLFPSPRQSEMGG